MTSEKNRELIETIMAALSVGDGQPFLDSMADDFAWMLMGTTPWSGLYNGKKAVQEDLFRPLFAQFETKYTNTAHRILVDGDFVVVECHGKVMTKAGRPYNNSYCWVIRLENGKMKRLTEYMDTALVDTQLEAPGVYA